MPRAAGRRTSRPARAGNGSDRQPRINDHARDVPRALHDLLHEPRYVSERAPAQVNRMAFPIDEVHAAAEPSDRHGRDGAHRDEKRGEIAGQQQPEDKQGDRRTERVRRILHRLRPWGKRMPCRPDSRRRGRPGAPGILRTGIGGNKHAPRLCGLPRATGTEEERARSRPLGARNDRPSTRSSRLSRARRAPDRRGTPRSAACLPRG